jgi:hypothetical protein
MISKYDFLDLCIRFGKMISKVCEGFNSGAMKKANDIFSVAFFIVLWGILGLEGCERSRTQ